MQEESSRCLDAIAPPSGAGSYSTTPACISTSVCLPKEMGAGGPPTDGAAGCPPFIRMVTTNIWLYFHTFACRFRRACLPGASVLLENARAMEVGVDV